MTPKILCRCPHDCREELATASKYMPVVTSTLDVRPGDLVIARYSAQPFYKLQETDIGRMGGKLINSFREYQFAADLREWYSRLLQRFTPKTWFRFEDVPRDGGPFVLKGSTNSRKFLWKTHMYAENFEAAVQVHSRLMQYSLIGDQDIVIRQYEPLVTLTHDPQGLPITQEYRFFVYKGEILSGGYYWSLFPEVPAEISDPSVVPRDFLADVVNRVKDDISFFAFDVAKTVNGGWLVIEINEGQMSGLSENDPNVLYSKLQKIILDSEGAQV